MCENRPEVWIFTAQGDGQPTQSACESPWAASLVLCLLPELKAWVEVIDRRSPHPCAPSAQDTILLEVRIQLPFTVPPRLLFLPAF